MNTLESYLLHAEENQKPILKAQWEETLKGPYVTCPCGREQYMRLSYRCLYCGIWFCVFCAQQHFGQTIEKWLAKKRAKLQKELSKMSSDQICERIKHRAIKNNK